MHNLKVKNYVLFGRLTKDYSLGYTVSETSEGGCKDVKVGQDIQEVLLKGKTHVVKYQKIYY